jgi:outer membrane biosynthesis protein TonB
VSPSREAAFLAVAVLLHAGIPLAARFIHPHASAAAEIKLHPMEVVVEIPVEPLNEPPPPAVLEPRAPSNEPTPPAPEQRVAAATNPRDPGAHVEPQTGPEPAGTVAPAAPGVPTGHAPDQYDALPPDGSGDGIARAPGLGAPIWTVPGAIPVAPRAAPAPTVATGPRPVDKDIAGIVIRGAMIENDKRLGLDLPGAGTVGTAVRAAVVSSDTPSEGRASFEVRVGADGRILGVRVASSTGGTSDVWDRVAKAVLAQLASKPLTLNANFAKGAIISVSVTSTMALPSGAKSAVSQQGSGIGFDVSDIGSHKSRSVKTSVNTTAIR